MALRVGIQFGGQRQPRTLRWGDKEAILPDGAGAGPCLTPAEFALRRLNAAGMDGEPDSIQGRQLFWFDDRKPHSAIVNFRTFDDFHGQRFGGRYELGGPKIEHLTASLCQYFEQRFGLDFTDVATGYGVPEWPPSSFGGHTVATPGAAVVAALSALARFTPNAKPPPAYSEWLKELANQSDLTEDASPGGPRSWWAEKLSGRPGVLRKRLPPDVKGLDPENNVETWGFGEPVFSTLEPEAPSWDMLWLHPSGHFVWQSARPTAACAAVAESHADDDWSRRYTVETGVWTRGADELERRIDAALRAFDESLRKHKRFIRSENRVGVLSRCDEPASAHASGSERARGWADGSEEHEALADSLRSLVRASEQGFIADPRKRAAIELAAMKHARKWLERKGFTNIKDTSKDHPYDYSARRGGVEHAIEVKGTTGDGGAVIVTANEVQHAASHPDASLMLVITRLQVHFDGQNWQAHGEPTFIERWGWASVATQLQPIAFRYRPGFESDDDAPV